MLRSKFYCILQYPKNQILNLKIYTNKRLFMIKKILSTIVLLFSLSYLSYGQIAQSIKISKTDWGKNFKFTGYVKSNDSLSIRFVTTQSTAERKYIKDKSKERKIENTNSAWTKFTLIGKIQRKCSVLSVWVITDLKMKNLYVDNISLEIEDHNGWRKIDLKNEDFEMVSDSVNKIVGWNVYTNYVATVEKTEKYSGQQSIQLVQHDLAKYGDNREFSQKIKINGVDIYYEIYGQGEPLLLLHGNNESISSFKYQIDEFKKYFKVIAVDSRGQGNSTIDKQKMTYDLLANDMNKLLDILQIDSVNILGWSDGGNTGLIMAMKYPNKVKRLIAMGANLYPNKKAIEKKFLSEYRWTLRLVKILVLFKPKQWKTKYKVGKMPLRYPNIKPIELQKITIPVLVMAGEKDVIKQAHTTLIADNISKSKLVILKGLSHYAPIENHKYFNMEVHAFLFNAAD